jgi:hypothetical protein
MALNPEAYFLLRLHNLLKMDKNELLKLAHRAFGTICPSPRAHTIPCMDTRTHHGADSHHFGTQTYLLHAGRKLSLSSAISFHGHPRAICFSGISLVKAHELV